MSSISNPVAATDALGYAQVTDVQTDITNETDLTGLSVTVTVAASRRIKISGYTRIRNDTADSGGIIRIKEGVTELQIDSIKIPVAATEETCVPSIILESPSAGSHTYKLTATRIGAGASILTLSAQASAPAYILVEDIGSV